MTSDCSESRMEGMCGPENSTGLTNSPDSAAVGKPEQDCLRGNQYILAETGCGMVFLKKDEETVAPS